MSAPAARNPDDTGRNGRFLAGLLVISALSLWMRTGFPAVDGGDSAYDDMLFIKLAGYLGSGHWLGPYNDLTLAKGMFYPLFILAAFASAIPLMIAEHIVYLAACALTAIFVARRARNCIALALFAGLAFNPVLWTPSLARVMREGIYLSQSLAVVTLVAMLAFPLGNASRRQSLTTAIGLGLVAASFWLTREEGVWLLPAIAFPIGLSALLLRRRAAITGVFRPFVTSLAVFLAVLATVASLNAHYYGVFRLTDFQSGSFRQAYGAISRIKPDSWRRYVVFPRDARERAYAVSPVARELKPFLEGDLAENWRKTGCDQTRTPNCPEVLSGWFMWELRGAVLGTGHANSGGDADAFYSRLAREINDACDSGRLECLPPRATMLPPFKSRYLIDALKPAGEIAGFLFHLGDGAIGSPPSRGEDSIFRIYAGLVGGVSPKPALPTTIIRGWAGSSGAPPMIYVAGSGNEETRSSVEILDPSYVSNPVAAPNSVRFVATTDCPKDRCALIFTDGDDQIRVPLAAPPAGTVTAGKLQMVLEDAGVQRLRDTVIDPSALRRAAQVKIATIIARFYRIVTPLLSILALAGGAGAILRSRRDGSLWPLIGLTLASAATILSRIALLSYLDVSSFPGTIFLYSSAASPFVIVFAVLGGYFAITEGLQLRKMRWPKAAQPIRASDG